VQEEENFEAKEDEIRRYSSKLLTICKTGWVATPADSLNPHPAHNGRSLPNHIPGDSTNFQKRNTQPLSKGGILQPRNSVTYHGTNLKPLRTPHTGRKAHRCTCCKSHNATPSSHYIPYKSRNVLYDRPTPSRSCRMNRISSGCPLPTQP
jgi:hypothetical protein